MQNNKFWFFGSKLNTVLLFVLIVLMVVALRYMWQDRYTYFPMLGGRDKTSINNSADLQAATEISGNKKDLVYFSIWPGSVLPRDIVGYAGSVQNGYFFEGNVLVNILDKNKQPIIKNHAEAITKWMTSDPVAFAGILDLSQVKPGQAFIEIKNDNASGDPKNDKDILVPIVIK